MADVRSSAKSGNVARDDRDARASEPTRDDSHSDRDQFDRDQFDRDRDGVPQANQMRPENQEAPSNDGAVRSPNDERAPAQVPARSKPSKTGDASQTPPDDTAAQDDNAKGKSSQSQGKTDDQKPQHRWRKWLIAAAVLVVLLIAGFIWGVPYLEHSLTHESTDDAFIDAHSVQISPKVSGYAVEVAVNDNQQVAAGDLLLKIDQREFQVALNRAQADLAAAVAQREMGVAQREMAQASVQTAEADLASSIADRANSESELNRVQEVVARKAATPEQLDQASATAAMSEATVRGNRSKVDSATADVKLAQAQIDAADAQASQARASIATAKLNLSYSEIYAPIAGRIARRSVNKGDLLQTGQALLVIVPANIYVTANYKETQLTDMRVGQPVQIEVDAFPDRPLRGHIDSFQPGTGAQFSLLPPENATGNYVKVVQRVPVKIVFDEQPEDLAKLSPGMSVVPDVKVKDKSPLPRFLTR